MQASLGEEGLGGDQGCSWQRVLLRGEEEGKVCVVVGAGVSAGGELRPVELMALPNLFPWTLEPGEVALGTVSDAISFEQEAGAVRLRGPLPVSCTLAHDPSPVCFSESSGQGLQCGARPSLRPEGLGGRFPLCLSPEASQGWPLGLPDLMAAAEGLRDLLLPYD